MRTNVVNRDMNIFDYYFVDKDNQEFSGRILFETYGDLIKLAVNEDYNYIRYCNPLNSDQERIKDIIRELCAYNSRKLSLEESEDIKKEIIDIIKRFEFDYFVPSDEMVTNDNIDNIEYTSDYTIRSLILLKNLGLSYKELDLIKEEDLGEYSLITLRGIIYKVIPDSELNDLLEERLYNDIEDGVLSMSNSFPRVEINGRIATVSISTDFEVDPSILGNGSDYDEEMYNGEIYYILKMD